MIFDFVKKNLINDKFVTFEGFLNNFGKRYENDTRAIFYQWSKVELSFKAKLEFSILNGI